MLNFYIRYLIHLSTLSVFFSKQSWRSFCLFIIRNFLLSIIWAPSQYRDGLSRYGDLHYKDKTDFIMGIPTLVRRHLYIEAGPWNFFMHLKLLPIASTKASFSIIWWCHYRDVIMSAMASQITSLTSVCSTVYLAADKKKTPKLRVTGLCAGNSPITGEFPAQRISNAENASIWWRRHAPSSEKFHHI